MRLKWLVWHEEAARAALVEQGVDSCTDGRDAILRGRHCAPTPEVLWGDLGGEQLSRRRAAAKELAIKRAIPRRDPEPASGGRSARSVASRIPGEQVFPAGGVEDWQALDCDRKRGASWSVRPNEKDGKRSGN